MSASPAVLVVEDEPEMLKLFTMIVKRENYRVNGEVRGTGALRYLQSNPTDLLVLDLKLPGMTGSEVIKMLRSSPQLRHIKVIVVTAYPNMIPEARSSGADMVFTKPVKPAVLLQAIAQLVG